MIMDLEKIITKFNIPKTANVAIHVCKLKKGKIVKEYKYLCNQKDNVFHPASLIKLFNSYLAYLQIGKQKNPEILRAIKESLKVSDNDALGLLVDFNSNTNSGPDLSQIQLAKFLQARGTITKYFRDKKYSKNLKLACKCFSFGPFGRDRQLIEIDGANQISVEDASKIILEIYNKSPQLLEFMKRDFKDKEDVQTKFITAGIYKKAKNIFSKAGWNSKVRHDTAIFTINKQEYLMTILTKGLSKRKSLIAQIASSLVSNLT